MRIDNRLRSLYTDLTETLLLLVVTASNTNPGVHFFRRVFLFAAVLFLHAGCAPRQVVIDGGITPLISTIQVYPTRDSTALVLQVTNPTVEGAAIGFATGQSFDFVILHEGNEIWRWSDGMMFTQAMRQEVLPAGDTMRFSATWPHGAEQGGTFVARAELTSYDHPLERSTTFEIR